MADAGIEEGSVTLQSTEPNKGQRIHRWLRSKKRVTTAKIRKTDDSTDLKPYVRDGKVRGINTAGTMLALKSIVVIVVFEIIKPLDAIANSLVVKARRRDHRNA